MNFQDAVKTVLTLNYANFNGRAARPEYRWYVLFVLIADIVLYIIDVNILGFQLLGAVFGLATLIPSLAVSVRRLHDIDKSGWWILLGIIPVIGWIILIYWYVQPGTPSDNQYGPPPAA
jgi:uncharacterized membrane protein YhaH (DUF805 family)